MPQKDAPKSEPLEDRPVPMQPAHTDGHDHVHVHGPGCSHSAAPYVRATKVGRNDPCTCGSGKKFKKCCAVSA